MNINASRHHTDRRIIYEQLDGQSPVPWRLAWSRIRVAFAAWWSGLEPQWISVGSLLPEKCNHREETTELIRWCNDCGQILWSGTRIGVEPELYRALLSMKEQVDAIAVFLRENYAEEIRRGDHNGRGLAEIVATYLSRERKAAWKLEIENGRQG